MLRDESNKAIEPVIANPKNAGLLIIGFKAWAAPQPPEGALQAREPLSTRRSRAVWDLQRGRVALTVSEYSSLREALTGLGVELEYNQLLEVPRGPEDLGEISFVHPREAPPAAFFVRGNLLLAVHSFGRESVDVLPFARQLDADLQSRPSEARDGGIDLDVDDRGFRAVPKWRGADGYLKVFAPGAELYLEGDAVRVSAGPEEVVVYSLEPGRETYVALAKRKP
ncbi:MAG TPA: hypothetical protein VGQ36_21745 [Thermoanaerobaculia bacterium]|jgi:hypothetical protein|nr:hypothetical protein [Thermoanaerobaculia bacterium]